jgi:ribosomal protein S18 acetylase RimI-like enzyme
MPKVRPMRAEDVSGAEVTWFEAANTMRASFHLPTETRTRQSVTRMRARLVHLLTTDPGGSWVAEDDDGQVVGIAQGLIRDDLWVLSLFGVAPRAQERGVGRELLAAAVEYGSTAPAGMILSSRDPRAMRRYTAAGFDLHPSVTAIGEVTGDLRGLVSGAVRDGGPADLGFAADFDRRTRRGAHGPDTEHLLSEGCRLMVLEGRGYVLARAAKPVFLAAESEEAATDLLASCLSRAERDEFIEVNWLTAGQQWAIKVVLQAGLVLHPVGPVMIRGLPAPPRCYLPSGAYG